MKLSDYTSDFSFKFRRLLSPLLFLGLILGTTINSSAQATHSKEKPFTIVLDAGHGGHDAGALKYLFPKHEKDIALDVTQKVAKLLRDSLKDTRVLLTRDSDVFIKLQDRHRIANQANGDLFVSIHVNATAGTRTRVQSGYHYVGKGKSRRKVASYKTVVNRSTNANGTETYVLGLHRNSQKSKAIEEYGENLIEDEDALLDENDPTTSILVAQYTQRFLSRSIDLASLIQNNFIAQGRNSYGVKQKGLEVLAGSVMPGVLVEIGFINNAEDEALLNSEKGQQQVAWAIFKGIRDYYRTANKTKKNNTLGLR